MQGSPRKKDPRLAKVVSRVYNIDYIHPRGYGCIHLTVEADGIQQAMLRGETLLDTSVEWEVTGIQLVDAEEYNSQMNMVKQAVASGIPLSLNKVRVAYPLKSDAPDPLEGSNITAFIPKSDNDETD